MAEIFDVSIIVPVYNREEIIKPCIKSINAQTYDKSKWEVIFVDDASTDKTVETIENLIDKSINYRILKRPIGSGTASAPRNDGIKGAQGKYVFFLDSDDYVDEQLLENGMKMALKNDSDMVYMKIIGIGRNTSKRPFMKGTIDKADIHKNHLLRASNPSRFIKLEILRKNNILFNPSLIRREDFIFYLDALIKSKNISILADKDYYIATLHDGEHLYNKPLDMMTYFQTIFLPLDSIYRVDYNELDKKTKLYNAWLVKSVEVIRDLSKKSNTSNLEFKNMFNLASNYFNIHKELFDLSQIYENEKLLTLLFLSGDFESFHKLANESKVLKSLQETLAKEFKTESSFSKAWIFQNKVAVLDFTLSENKIAFDLEVDEKNKLLKVWMFSRNNPNLLENLESKAIKIDKNKLLIFDGKLEQEKEAIEVIKNYFEKVKNG